MTEANMGLNLDVPPGTKLANRCFFEESGRVAGPYPEFAAGLSERPGRVSAMEDVTRFLEVVCRDLGAADARLEFGGRLPEDAVYVTLKSGFRVVALFDDPAIAEREAKQARLESLAQTFVLTLDSINAPSFRPVAGPRASLDEALEVLAGSAHASAAWVIDDHSPELWGSSLEPRGPETVEDALGIVELGHSLGDVDLAELLAGSEPTEISPALRQRLEQFRSNAPERSLVEWRKRLRAYEAASDAREVLVNTSGRTRHVRHEASGPYLGRTFGGLYQLLLIFDTSDFSELHAEAALIHALPWIEKLTGALPPVDPDGGGRVLSMRRLRPV